MLTKDHEELLALARAASPKDPQYEAEALQAQLEVVSTVLEALINQNSPDLDKLVLKVASRLAPEKRQKFLRLLTGQTENDKTETETKPDDTPKGQ